MIVQVYKGLISLMLVALTLCSCVTWDGPPHAGSIPSRPPNAPGAKALFNELNQADESEREAVILRELQRGNLPDCLRQQERVRFLSRTRSGRLLEVTLWVLPDYLAIGSDQDFVRIPMSPITAQRIANSYGFVLPTAKIVDAIYQMADLRVAPRPFPPSRAMVSMGEYYRHHEVIQTQVGRACSGRLLAGHKKDVVITNQLLSRPKKVAIYGWHQVNGQPIQPLSLVHGNYYADYSHGIRLINVQMLVEDKVRAVAEVLQDPELAPLLSYEGALRMIRYGTAIGDLNRHWWPQSRSLPRVGPSKLGLQRAASVTCCIALNPMPFKPLAQLAME